MKVSVRYFASIREALGPMESVELPSGSSIGALRQLLVGRSGAHAEALGPGKALRAALNQTLSDESALLEEGAEVAFFPPVTGG
jgi:molybdopterin synthase sulfur carrier subunit